MKSQIGGKNKNPRKSEINHFVKKNTAIPMSSTSKKGLSGYQLSQVDSMQSIRTSPIKSDNIGPKHYPQSIQKTSTHKTQRMHKKVVSLMGNSQISQTSMLPFNQEHGFLDQTKNLGPHQRTLKQSQIPSSQSSFNDYNSTTQHINNYGEIKAFPKMDNFLMNATTAGDKNGSLLTAQQQQQVKMFQKMLHESQLSQQTFEHMTSTQDIGVKTFDQRLPLNQPMSSHQSQRLSLVSDTPHYLQNPGYRSHANSFKGSHNNIAMKHAPQKYIKGCGTTAVTAAGSANTTSANLNCSQGTSGTQQVRTKKTLQYHHQRTLSDNPASFTNSKAQLFNANPINQVTNRNFQELIRSANSKDQPNANLAKNHTQESYPRMMSSTITNRMNKGQHYQHTKTTIGSSRQSQAITDERDPIMQHYQGSMLSKDKIADVNQIYHGSFKDQIMKTKQALKLTQQQFGGPSRKVVSNNKFIANVNTQSYRVPTQQTLTSTSLSKMTFNHGITKDNLKQTPKPNYHKKGKSIQINQSQVGQGSRTTQNSTTLTHNQRNIMYSDKVKKQKPLKGRITTGDGSSTKGQLNTMALNFNQASSEISIMGLQKSHAKTFHKTGINVVNAHKRSVSDGNAIVFQSLNNKAQINQNNVLMNKGLNSLTQSLNLSNPHTDSIKNSNINKKTSLHKIQSNQYSNHNNATSSNEYQVISHRHSYNQSLTTQPNNVLIHSHRKVGEIQGTKHMRHYSEQVTINNNKLNKQEQNLGIQKKTTLQQKSLITIQKSQRQVNEDNNSINGSEMMIMDQGINQIHASQIKQHSVKDSISNTPIHGQNSIKLNTFYQQSNQQSQTFLKPVEERIETQESAISDPNLTPRSRMNVKIHKKIKLAFQKSSSPNNATFTTSIDFYKIGKVMGKGAFGKVNLAIHRLSNKFVALKSINKTFLSEEASKRKVMQEFNILRRTRHKNIVRLYESFETAQHIVFVMEVCGAGDLLTYVRRRRKLKEDVAKHLFKQVVEGLKYCHSKNILHRDIKLDNILLTSEGDIKICDFGVSKLVKPGEIMTEQCGTPAYIAPEVFENKGYEGYASDVWSAGVVLYAMLYGTVPFKANNMTELQKQITKCQTTFKDEISPDSINLLKGILERDPLKRLKISEILRHPWMQDIPEKMSVFTDQEKEKIILEFAYYNFKNVQGNDAGEVVHTDPFTEQMLNSTQNSLVRNASTKSVILAPFNSTRSHIDENYHMRKSIQDLIIDKKNIKFAAKVKEIDRQYEANNNAELDNGVYHQDSEEEEQKQEEEKKEVVNNDDNEDDEYGLNDERQKKQSEWQKLEQMVIDRQKTEEEEEDNYQKERLLNLGSAQTLVIDEKLISDIEVNGFPKQYIINSLNNDDMNYVTTYYYLLTTSKEY